ncbi:MAG: signal peptidase I [Pseudobdellovibrionaceae bacterium]
MTASSPEKSPENQVPHTIDLMNPDKAATVTSDMPSAPPKEEEKEESMGEVARTVIIAMMIALLLRTFLFEPFNIPSGSMYPNLMVGDYLFISKSSYGYSKYSFPFGIADFDGRMMASDPVRGDVIVFKLPTNPKIDFVKRLIGLPGDTIQMIEGRLYINDEIVPRDLKGTAIYTKENGREVTVNEYVETLPGGTKHTIYEESDHEELDNTAKFKIPDGHYFMMGDNRDNSRDSRVQELVGFVPYDNLEGRAEILFFSTDGTARFYEVWKWPFAVRYDRLFNLIEGGVTAHGKE